MLCPNCQSEIIDIKTESKYGATIIFNQCQKCGGIWLDGQEMYLIKPEEGKRYDEINIDALAANVGILENLVCPRDNSQLKIFRDPTIPESIKIASCPKCGGFWFNHGEFKEFIEMREKHLAEEKSAEINDPKKDKFMEEVDKMFALQYKPDNKNNSLISPVNLGYPSNINQEVSDVWMTAATILINVLLRLFVK